jgi:CheY-like chemotaxis protein
MSMIDAASDPTTSGVRDFIVARPTDPDAPPAAAVLIVDDSPVERRLVSAIVARRAGLRPVMIASGREALDLIARDVPAAVVTDLQMPGMNGLELVEAIRKDYPGLPVVLMTAYGSEDIAIRALRAGAANYVPKKALARELAETLDAVLAASANDGRRRKLRRCVESTRSRFRLSNDPELIAPLIALLQEGLDGLGLCDSNTITRVGVALQETLANALYHGNLEVSSELRQEDERVFYAEADARRRQAPYRDRTIHVEADLDRDAATFRIRDEGPGFDTARLDAPFDPESLMRVGGRGLILIRSFMDEVRYNARGNEITLIKRRAIA